MKRNGAFKKLGFLFFSVTFLLFASANTFSLSVPATSTGDYTVTFDAPTASNHFYTLYQTGTSVSTYPVPLNHSSKTYTNMPSGTYHYQFDRCIDHGPWVGTFCDSHMGPLPTVTVQVTNTPPIPPVPGAPGVGPSPATDQTRIIFTLGSNETSSQIQESKNGSATWTPVTTTTAYWNDIYLTRDSGSYRYRRNSCNANGCSGYSAASASITLQNIPDLPYSSAPITSTTGAFTFSWQARDTAAEDSATYVVEKVEVGVGVPANITANLVISGTNLTISESGLADGSYYYQIKACNPSNLCSEWSRQYVNVEITPTVPVITAPPTVINQSRTYDVGLDSSGIVTRYELREFENGAITNGGGTNVPAINTFIQSTDATYGYQARACNNTCSAWSAIKNVQVLRTPSTPTNFSAPSTSGSGNFNVTWSAVSEVVDYYELAEGFNGQSPLSPLVDSDGNALGEVRTSLPIGTYEYQVRACNVLSCSPWSASIFTEVSPAVASISGPSSSATGTFTLNWTPDHQLLIADGHGTYTGTSKTFSDLPSGVYNFSLDYCEEWTLPLGESGGTTTETFCQPSTAETKTVVVTRDAEPVIQNLTTVAGSSNYSANVSQRGSARISLPLASPPGINGFQPGLSIEYDSARATNVADVLTIEDSLGYGWRLAGLSYLHRCRVGLSGSNKILLDTSDRLCLDGSPLIAVAGTYWSSNAEYRTEIQTFTKITPNGTGFTVEYSDGRVGYFGTTSDSRNYLAQAGTYEWHLTEMTHPMAVGSSMQIDYHNFSGYGSVVPEKISYAGAEIEFKYGPRSDIPLVQMGNGGIGDRGVKRSTVLHTISMSLNGNPLREIRLDSNSDSAGRVRLERVQECAFDEYGSSIACMSPINFTWSSVTASESQYPVVISALTDGFNSLTEFDYTNVSTSVNPSSYPQTPFDDLPPITGIVRQPLAVVTEFRKSDGLSATTQKRWTYNYKGSSYKSTSNRGYVGFYENHVKDEQTRARIYTQMRMDFPFFGAVSRSVSTTNIWGTGVELSRSEFSYTSTTLSNGTLFNYADQSTIWSKNEQSNLSAQQTNNEVCFRQLVNGACPSSGPLTEFITQSSTTNIIASDIANPSGSVAFWGDVPHRNVTGEQQTVVTNASFNNLTSPWVIGATAQVTTTHSVPNKPSRTVSNVASYKPGTLTVQSSTIFPGNSELEVTQSLNFNGNLVGSETLSAVDAPSRTITLSNFVGDRYPTSVSNDLGHQTQIAYDLRFGTPKTITDVNGNTSEVLYDQFGRVVSSLAHDGTLQTMAYERCEQVTCPPEVTDKAVMKITNTTTNLGVQVAPTSAVYLDRLGRTVLQETQAFNASNGWQRQFVNFDNRGRLESQSRPYFSTGTVPSCATPGSCTKYEYSIPDHIQTAKKMDRIIYSPGHQVDIRTQSTLGQKRITRAESSSAGSKSKSVVYNLLGQVIETTEKFGEANNDLITTKYDYDAHGNLIEVEIDDRIVATMDYELNGNRNYIFDVNTGVITTDANALGEVLTVTDAKNQITKFQYDTLGRLKTRWDDFGGTQESTNQYTYDPANAIGALASRSNEQFIESYQYRASDSKLVWVNTYFNVQGVQSGDYYTTYDYDPQGRLSTINYPSGFSTTQTYSDLGYLNKLFDGAHQLQSVEEMNKFGQATLVKLGDQGLQTQNSYDGLGRLRTIQTGSIATPKAIQDIEYKWNSDNSLLQRIEKRNSASTGDDVADTFSYDLLDRLKEQSTTGTAVRTLSFTYDNYGNITQKQTLTGMTADDVDATGFDYSDPVSPHRLLSVTIDGVDTDFEYDDNGNITRYDGVSGDDTFIEYDGQNQVSAITLGGSAAEASPTARDEFWYDPDGNRFLHRESWQESGTQEKLTTYIGNFEEIRRPNSSLEVIQMTDLGSVRHFRRVSVLGQVNTFFEFVHRDHQGSVDAITDEAGNILSKLSFDAFGGQREDDWSQPLHPLTISFLLAILDERPARGYTGHEHLPRTGFIHMNGRVYDPRIGRFLSPDPYVQAPTMSQSYNRYAYVMNNPVMYTDPSGYFIKWSGGQGWSFWGMNSDGGWDFGTFLSDASFGLSDTIIDFTRAVGKSIGSFFTATKGKLPVVGSQTSGSYTVNGWGDIVSNWVGGPPCPDCAANIAYMKALEGAHIGVTNLSSPEIDQMTGDATGVMGIPESTNVGSSVNAGTTTSGSTGSGINANAINPFILLGLVNNEGIPDKFNLYIGTTDLTRNTVVTDGSGGMKVQFGANAANTDPLVLEAIRLHEEQHIRDFRNFGKNIDVLKGNPANLRINIPTSQISVIEKRATRVEIYFLQNQLPNASPQVTAAINHRLSTLATQYNGY